MSDDTMSPGDEQAPSARASYQTKPTDAELRAHNAAGGWWLLSRAGYQPVVEAFANGDMDMSYGAWADPACIWTPLSRDGVPCDRPVAL